MKSIDDAIKHCEEVAKEQDKLATRYEDASGYSRSHIESLKTNESIKCRECAKEHRQLAEWLRELQEFKALFVKANRDVGNVHLDNRAIFEKFFWDCWRIFKADGEVNADEDGD